MASSDVRMPVRAFYRIVGRLSALEITQFRGSRAGHAANRRWSL